MCELLSGWIGKSLMPITLSVSLHWIVRAEFCVSVAVSTKGKVPAVVGVPVNWQALFLTFENAIPAGGAPLNVQSALESGPVTTYVAGVVGVTSIHRNGLSGLMLSWPVGGIPEFDPPAPAPPPPPPPPAPTPAAPPPAPEFVDPTPPAVPPTMPPRPLAHASDAAAAIKSASDWETSDVAVP